MNTWRLPETMSRADSLKLNAQELEKETLHSTNTHMKTLMRQNDKNKPYFHERDSVVSLVLHLISVACQEHTATFTGTVTF